MAYLGILNLILSLFLAGFNLSPALHSNPDILHLDPTASVFELAADKGAVLDGSGRFFLFAKNADEIQPIASITKLMTALVFLEHNPGWEVIYEITAADRVEGGRLNLFPGDQVTLKDLFYTALVASDNGAALALTRASNLGEERFIIAMNEKAAALGLKATHFVDPACFYILKNSLKRLPRSLRLCRLVKRGPGLLPATCWPGLWMLSLIIRGE